MIYAIQFRLIEFRQEVAKYRIAMGSHWTGLRGGLRIFVLHLSLEYGACKACGRNVENMSEN